MGAIFSAPFHPASYTTGTGSFLGVKRLGRGVDHPPPSTTEIKERVELYLYSTSGPSWPFLECNLPLPLYRVSQEEQTKLRESVPYVKLYRYNPKHLYPKLNVYGDNGQRKVWTSCISAYCTSTAVERIDRETVTAQAPPNAIR